MSDIAVLFPGQGSQESGMGRALAEQSAEAMDFWKKAERISGLPLREIYWDGDDAAMADTRALQPALTVVTLNIWRQLAPRCTPGAVAGHSLGEYSALAAANVINADAVLELTALRGRLMADADPEGRGAMAAVLKIPQHELQALVDQTREATEDVVLIANYNTPGQLVVSGARPAVDHLLGLVKANKGRAIPLKVSGAFHSPLMEDAAREMRNALKKVVWQRPRFAVYCNVHGRAVTDGESLRECMLDQMTSSVQWVETIRWQWRDGIRHWVEAGPKAVLSKMVAPCLDGVIPDGGTPRVDTVVSAEEAATFSV